MSGKEFWQMKMPAHCVNASRHRKLNCDEVTRVKALGFHFRRQAPIGRYVVDFVSFRSRLVIEADGGQHGSLLGAQRDQVRDAFLLSQGFRVLRFWNSDIDDNLAGVMESVLNALNRPPPDWPAASHPPHKGEG